jgi:hypothetical protein
MCFPRIKAVAEKKCGGGSKTCPQPIRVEGGHSTEICKRPPKSSGGGRLQISAECLPETAIHIAVAEKKCPNLFFREGARERCG